MSFRGAARLTSVHVRTNHAGVNAQCFAESSRSAARRASSAASPSTAPDDTPSVPPLARPPGVRSPPRGGKKTWEQRKDEYLDKDRFQTNRRALFVVRMA